MPRPFCLRFAFAFSGSSSDSVPLSLRFSGSFSGFTIRFAFSGFDTGVFRCEAVGFGFFSGGTFAFSGGGVSFVYAALALGLFLRFAFCLGSHSADAFSLGVSFAFDGGLFRLEFCPGSFSRTARFFFTLTFGFSSFSSTYAFGFSSSLCFATAFRCFLFFTGGFLTGGTSLFFSGGLGFFLGLFSSSGLCGFRFTAGFGSSFFCCSTRLFLTTSFFCG